MFVVDETYLQQLQEARTYFDRLSEEQFIALLQEAGFEIEEKSNT